jgi:carboxyl-terminal processing protease
LLGLGLGVLLALVFAAGFLLNDMLESQTAVAAPASESGYALLDEVQALVDRFFVREQPDYRDRQYGAVRGMLASLNDPYTFFIEPSTAASESDVLAGVYGGVGVQVTRDAAGELVLYPFEAGPAAQAGIQPGDRLIAVDGEPLDAALSLDVIDQMLRGEVTPGNGVSMTVRRGEREEDYFVEFAVINVPSVIWRMLEGDDAIGYIQILRFTARTPDELQAAADGLRAAGADGIVLDLRDNSGGLLQESIEVADAFIDSGVLVYERSPSGERAFDATAGGSLVEVPVVVLVNHRTASGAEIVAGALRDSGRALLFGERTYGKGTVQQILPLSDTSSLHITSSEWLTPARAPLDQVGLQPDTEIAPDANGMDTVLPAAVQALQAQLSRQGVGV